MPGPDEEASAPPPRGLTRPLRQKLAFSLAVTAIFLLVLEGALRGLGLGDPDAFGGSRLKEQRVFPPLFGRTKDGSGYRPKDRRLVDRFFPRPIAGKPTTRIFVFGESAVAGLGMSENASFPRALERRLAAAGARGARVVNCGVMALSARQVLLIERDVARLRKAEGEPAARDVFVFHVGNNEFLELHSQRFLEKHGGEPFAMRLDRGLESLRLYSFLKTLAPSVYGALTPRLRHESPLHQAEPIEVTVEERKAAVARLSRSMLSMVAIAREAGATPVLMTVPVNLEWSAKPERGWLADACGELATDPEERRRQLEAARAALDARLKAGAGPALERWKDLERRAHVRRALGDADGARADLGSANDEDPHLLRCLGVMNENVRALANAEHVALADGERALENVSPDRIPGFSLFFDNVHFTPGGSERVAEELHAALARASLVPALDDSGKYVGEREEKLAAAKEDSLSVREWIGWNADRAMLTSGAWTKYDNARAALEQKEKDGVATGEELVWAANGHALELGGEQRARELYAKARAKKPELAKAIDENLAWLDGDPR